MRPGQGTRGDDQAFPCSDKGTSVSSTCRYFRKRKDWATFPKWDLPQQACLCLPLQSSILKGDSQRLPLRTELSWRRHAGLWDSPTRHLLTHEPVPLAKAECPLATSSTNSVFFSWNVVVILKPRIFSNSWKETYLPKSPSSQKTALSALGGQSRVVHQGVCLPL